jgi:Na+-transporting NADH:ubiquinone oxidoreductase subunit NqrF
MIPIMPDEDFQQLSEEEQNAQWDRELDSMNEEDCDRFKWERHSRFMFRSLIFPDDLVVF